jgi:RimJ/RimL family protein N-acetyltransferase
MEFIGEAGIIGYNPRANRCVIGYNLLPQYWEHGYATEITKHLVKYSFEFFGYGSRRIVYTRVIFYLYFFNALFE